MNMRQNQVDIRNKDVYTCLDLFFLFILLYEGKSNVCYRLVKYFCGHKYAVKLYFKRLLKGCDKGTYEYYCKLFVQQTRKDIAQFIVVEVDACQRLTGYFKNNSF